MIPIIEDRVNIEDFVLENNVLKGVSKKIFYQSNVGEIFFETFNNKPDHVTQIDAETGKQTTFAETKDRSVRCALWLQKQGIGSGDIVTICTHNQLDAYMPIIATFFTGAIFNAWGHETALNPARHLMKQFEPKIIFVCESMADILLEAAKLENVNTRIIVFGNNPRLESFSDILLAPNAKEVQAFRPQEINDLDQTAVIMLSSGSSGMPKGVVHSYKNLFNSIVYVAPYAIKGVAFYYSTCSWASGLLITMQNILLNGTRIIHTKCDPETVCQVIEKYKVNFLFILPYLITYIVKSDVLQKYNLESLKFVSTGGTTVNTEAFLKFKKSLPNVIVSHTYGMTEMLRCCISQTENSKNPKSVGFISLNIELKIIDLKSGKVLGPNEPGELCFKSKILMKEYYKDTQKTKEAVGKEGWLHTGDMGYYDQNGEVIIIDRIKDVMKYRGHQISAIEIENVLLTHPDVMEAAAVPIPDEVDIELPMAFVKKVPGSKVTEEELVQLSTVLGENKKLQGGVKFIEVLPKTTSGKICKNVLKEMARTLAKNK